MTDPSTNGAVADPPTAPTHVFVPAPDARDEVAREVAPGAEAPAKSAAPAAEDSPKATAPKAASPAARVARPTPPKPPGPMVVVAGSLAVFLVVLTFLALQVRSGEDPAIGAAKAAPAAEPRRVLVRRVVRGRTVVVPAAPAVASGGGGGAVAASAPAGGGSAPAPAAAAAAPAAAAAAPAPAPAPAPPPVVSQAS